MNRASPVRSCLWVGLLCACLVAASGCVYWRLNQFRRQLGVFARFGTLEYDPGPVIGFRKPVLKPDDIRWLIGREPTRREPNAWHYDFRKRAREPADSESDFVITLSLGIENGRVTHITLPPRFNEVVTLDVLNQAFRGVDSATVNRDQHATGWRLDTGLAIPSPGMIRDILGRPARTEDTETHAVSIYEFDLGEPATGVSDPDGFALFVADPKADRIEQVHLRAGILSILVKRDAGGRYHVRVKRGKPAR